MTRFALVLLFAWTLLLLPALCTGGWLLHPCDCGAASGCAHEAGCGTDPCELDVARADAWSHNRIEIEADSAVALGIDVHRTAARQAQPLPRWFRSAPVSVDCARPYPPSDLPLLI